MSLWGSPTVKGSGWGPPKKVPPKKSKEDPKTAHLVTTDFWGRKIHCDPKTGKPIQNPKGEVAGDRKWGQLRGWH